MALNKETHVSASVILPKALYQHVRMMAKENGRSASAEMVKAIEQVLEVHNHGVDSQERRA